MSEVIRKLIPVETNILDAEEHVKALLRLMGEDINREGLLKTPYRVIKSFEELYAGYKEDPADILGTTFESDADEMVFCNDIDFWSTCEHHMIPFFGKVHIAYVPKGRVVGLSKLARVVNVFAKRLQIQEQMTTQIADAIMTHIDAEGVGVVVEAQHLCMKARGVKNPSSYMKTSKLLGCFKEPTTRSEFYHLIQRSSNGL